MNKKSAKSHATTDEKKDCLAGGAFFVYGTLMRCEERFPVLKKYGLRCVLLAETPGTLLDLGAYPGMIEPVDVSAPFVQGEFVVVQDMAGALKELDRIEGFRGEGSRDSLFQRKLIEVGMCDGRVRQAWTYYYAQDSAKWPVIESADWREHRGTRTRFMERLVARHVDGQEQEIAERLAAQTMFTMPEDVPREAAKLIPLSQALMDFRISERKLAQATGKWTVVPDSSDDLNTERKSTVYYFAYGSNLLQCRLAGRVGPIRGKAIRAHLNGWRLAFNKLPKNDTSHRFANIIPQADGVVWGVLYELTQEQMAELDKHEGVQGGHYERKEDLCVETDAGRKKAITYIAGEKYICKEGQPSEEYLGYILTGASDHGLPEEAIAEIERRARGQASHGSDEQPDRG